MSREVNQVRWDQWRQRLEKQRASGQSIVAFCREEGVSQATFHVWKRKLRDPSSARPSADEVATVNRSRRRRGAVPRHRRPENSAASSTAPTRVAEFLQLPVCGVRSSTWIEVTLVDGTLVRVPQENLAALTTLLRVLRGDRCDSLPGEVRHA